MRPQKESTHPQSQAGNVLPHPSFVFAPKPEKPKPTRKKKAFPISKHQKANQTTHESQQEEENIKQQNQPYPEDKTTTFTHPDADRGT